MEEIWKDIIWYEWLYQISNLWKVKSLLLWKERILGLRKIQHYTKFSLYLNWLIKTVTAHRLVAINFIPNPDNLFCVLHKDETLDENWLLYNWADNLFWWTQNNNMQDMIKKWRHGNNGKFGRDNPTSKQILQYTKDLKLIKEWGSMMEVKRELWISNASISSCCIWKLKTAWGFIWKYS